MGRAWKTVLLDGGCVTNQYFMTGELATNFGARAYPVAYTYDYDGRKKTMQTWTNFAGGQGLATTTWNYDGYRGFLTNKVYADGNGPKYTYTSSGQLATRTCQRGHQRGQTIKLSTFYLAGKQIFSQTHPMPRKPRVQYPGAIYHVMYEVANHSMVHFYPIFHLVLLFGQPNAFSFLLFFRHAFHQFIYPLIQSTIPLPIILAG